MNGCSTREHGPFRVVAVTGEVDLSWSSEIRGAILEALTSDRPVMVDLSAVTYIDSSGIAALVEGYQTARGKSVGFGLVSISDAVRAVLELARLDQVFPIYADLDSVPG